LCERKLSMFLFFIFSVLFFFMDLSFLADYNYFNIANFNRYLVFFFFGITFFRYEGWKWTASWQASLLLLVVYVVLYLLQVPLFTSLVGILLLLSISQQVALFVPKLFGSFRDYIFPIYLMSFVFQPFVELVLWKKLFYNENLFLLFYVLNVLTGIYGSVVVSKLVERIPIRFVRYCFGLNK